MTDEQIELIMEQAQVFASAWSLVGGPFDTGGMLETAEEEKKALRALLSASKPAATHTDYDDARRMRTLCRLLDAMDDMGNGFPGEVHAAFQDGSKKTRAALDAAALPEDFSIDAASPAAPEGWKLVAKLVKCGDVKGAQWFDIKVFDRTLEHGTPLYAAPPAQTQVALTGWQPIDTAPEGKLVVVAWLDKDDPDNPERHMLDFIEDGGWVRHNEDYDHYLCVAPPGSRGPSADAPYTHWLDIPEVPTAAQPALGAK